MSLGKTFSYTVYYPPTVSSEGQRKAQQIQFLLSHLSLVTDSGKTTVGWLSILSQML